jgi:hypothetical protein
MTALLGATACDFIKFKSGENDKEYRQKPVARVHDSYLYPEDLEGLIPLGMSREDSIARTESYVNNWMRKQLLIHEASTRIEIDEAEIERKILEYRYSLIGYEYQTYYINQNLDREVSDGEIQEYYQKNLDNFVLKQNIVRGRFISVPKGAPRTNQLPKLIKSNKPADLEELRSYCLSFATAYHLEDTVWVNFDEVIKTTPLAEIPNKVQFLRNNKYVENSDSDNEYYLRIDEYKKSDDISPLEVVREQIITIIINKRKIELAKQLEQEVYERASKNNDFEIYSKQ